MGEAGNGSASKDEIVPFSLAGHEMLLGQNTDVFRPTLTTRLLIEQVIAEGVRGKRALDLGCGSGPIAIALAMAGAGHVYATDAMLKACVLAQRSVQLNGLSHLITVARSDLFEALEGQRFDLIVDDVSGVAEDVARQTSWFPAGVPLGGADGADLTVRVLQDAKRHLTPNGVLFFPVLGLSNVQRILTAAHRSFGATVQRVATKLVPFSAELLNGLETLKELKQKGLIDFEHVRGRCLWRLDIYRASNESGDVGMLD